MEQKHNYPVLLPWVPCQVPCTPSVHREGRGWYFSSRHASQFHECYPSPTQNRSSCCLHHFRSSLPLVLVHLHLEARPAARKDGMLECVSLVACHRGRQPSGGALPGSPGQGYDVYPLPPSPMTPVMHAHHRQHQQQQQQQQQRMGHATSPFHMQINHLPSPGLPTLCSTPNRASGLSLCLSLQSS